MSYDVSLEITDAKGDAHELFWRNYTSNLSDAWTEAGINICDWDGVHAGLALVELQLGIPKIEADVPGFKERHDPPNGWGGVESMLEFLSEIRDACERWPDATVRVSR